MLPENIIWVGVFLNLVGQLFYVRSIIEGHAKPNLVSWFIFMLAPFIGVFFQLKAGAGLSTLSIFMSGFGSLMIIITSILVKNGYWKITAFDVYCGLLSLIALIFYIFTHNLGISIIFAISSDALAFIPSYVKAWKFPETEYHSTYSLPTISHIIGLLIIKNWSFTIYSFGLYMVISNMIMLTIIYRKKIFGPASVSFI